MLRLFIHESSELVCATKCLHRSGSHIRPVSVGDPVFGSGGDETACGTVIVVEQPERIDRENWLYRVQYRPLPGTVHPIDGFVIWRQIEAPKPKTQVPEPIAQRMTPKAPEPVQVQAQRTEQVPVAEVGQKPTANGKHKRKKVNGQQGSVAPASATSPTA